MLIIAIFFFKIFLATHGASVFDKHNEGIQKQAEDIANMSLPDRTSFIYNLINRFEEARSNTILLQEQLIDYQREVSLITALSMIERLEGKLSSGFDAKAVPRTENVRKKRWSYMFQTHRDAPEIEYILQEIHGSHLDTKRTEEEVISNIAETADVLEKIERDAINNIVITMNFLNHEKHKHILGRNINMPLVLRKEIPNVVKETALLLGKAYVKFLVGKEDSN